MTTAPSRPRTALEEETLYWFLHHTYVAHMQQEPPCADCGRDQCVIARWLDEKAGEADLAWGRRTGGWW